MSATALIVEDEIFVALDLERILINAGYSVAGIAADRTTALSLADQCAFAFVDINLRDGATGPDIATTLAHQHGVRVVFVTANPAHITDETGAIAFVRKPFSEQAIRAAAAIASSQAHPDRLDVDDLVLLGNDNRSAANDRSSAGQSTSHRA